MPRLLSVFAVASMAIATLTPAAPAQPWRELEAPLLTRHVQLTSDADFIKAGEAYFSADGRRVIFQAVPVPPEGEEPSPHYGMYLAEVVYSAEGDITGLANITLLSPEGSAATCGSFHPSQPFVIFGCTLTPPSTEVAPGYQRAGSRYAWSFPTEMDICGVNLQEIGLGQAGAAQPLFKRPGYDAECSISPDERFILYVNVDPAKGDKPDADIWVFDTLTQKQTPLITAEGYDGGPFFSPDGSAICYRSDRKGDDRLQLFIATLTRDSSGAITGIAHEIAITDNEDVNWAPFWHPSAQFLAYTGSRVGHHNYEVLSVALDADLSISPAARTHRRVTFASGFDGLPAFNADASWMIWTSQRSADGAPGSSQLWAAKANADPVAWNAPLTREQALALAEEFLAAELPGVEFVRLDGEPIGRDWIITAIPLDFTGGSTLVSVDEAGVVKRRMPSRD